MKNIQMPYCLHNQDGKCTSCPKFTQDYSLQIKQKEEDLKDLMQSFLCCCDILPAVTSPLVHFRNKAKMVVSGSVERPILGILPDPKQSASALDLCDCPLYPHAFYDVFKELKDFIARSGLVPYNVAKQKGELKHILLTQSQHTNKLMLRFVLRSEKKRSLIERELAGLLQRLPLLEVVSLNIQPKNAAILEGEQEIFLTEKVFLAEKFNDIPLYIRPQGFFQTNPLVASQLYKTASEWITCWAKNNQCSNIWDLFCGCGGFGLHIANSLRNIKKVDLTGIEISPAAIACAKKSAEQLALPSIHFQALDIAHFNFMAQQAPEIVVVNPPRRGIGQDVASFLAKLQPKVILYSSCNAKSMAKDLQYLFNYQLKKLQLFDMFPHSEHYEVLGMLEKQD